MRCGCSSAFAFYFVLIFESFTFAGTLFALIQSGVWIANVRYNGLTVDEPGPIAYVSVSVVLFVLHLAAVIVLPFGHYKKRPEPLIYYLIWCLLFRIIIITAIGVAVLILMNNAYYQQRQQQLQQQLQPLQKQQQEYDKHNLDVWNVVLITLVAFNFIFGVLCFAIILRCCMRYREARRIRTTHVAFGINPIWQDYDTISNPMFVDKY